MSRTPTIVLTALVVIIMVMALAMPARAYFGCGSGFWRNHFEDWDPTGLNPVDLFDAVFGVSTSGFVLLDALEARGGGELDLMRHAVAAYLNAAHPDVDFLYTPPVVIDIVQMAYASGDFESAKKRLEAANDQGCPL